MSRCFELCVMRQLAQQPSSSVAPVKSGGGPLASLEDGGSSGGNDGSVALQLATNANSGVAKLDVPVDAAAQPPRPSPRPAWGAAGPVGTAAAAPAGPPV